MSHCIIFEGHLNSSGYGKKRIAGTQVLAHRAAYCASKGLSLSDIQGKFVCHACDTPACVNPKHLWLGTAADNNRDRDLKGRTRNSGVSIPNRRGAFNPRSVLTEHQVIEARRVWVKGDPIFGGRPLARRFNVDIATMVAALVGRTWAHIPNARSQ